MNYYTSFIGKCLGCAVLVGSLSGFCQEISVADSGTVSKIESAGTQIGEEGDSSSKIGIGIKGGINLGSAKYSEIIKGPGLVEPLENSVDGEKINAAVVSAFVEIPFTSYFSLQPEIAFAQKGFKHQIDERTTKQFRFNYLELPLLAKIKFDLGHVTPYALAGLAGSYLISQSYVVARKGVESAGEFYREDFAKFVLSVSGGLGINIKLNEVLTLLFEGRFSRNLTNAMSKNFGSDAKLTFWGVQGTAGLQVSL